MTIPIGALVMAAFVGTQDGTPPPTPRIRASDLDAFYLVTAPVVVYAAPGSTEVRGRLKRFDFPFLVEIGEGWTHVLVVGRPPDARWQYDGWIKGADSRNRLPDRRSAEIRVAAVKVSGWLVAIQDDVVRGRVRPGFTKSQVRTAHVTSDNIIGGPIRRKTSETAFGTREVWIYVGEALTFAGDRLVEIETVE